MYEESANGGNQSPRIAGTLTWGDCQTAELLTRGELIVLQIERCPSGAAPVSRGESCYNADSLALNNQTQRARSASGEDQKRICPSSQPKIQTLLQLVENDDTSTAIECVLPVFRHW